jgi:hypothetical protein
MQKKEDIFGLLDKKNKKAQLAIFVIVAIIIVGGIVGFFLLRNNVFSTVPKSIAPVQEYYSSCIESIIREGAGILGSRAGYLESPDFKPGNTYAPFSSELDFMGTGVPYWYYISSSGLVSEQIPTKKQMEQQLNSYLEQRAGVCNLDSFVSQGYIVTMGAPKFKTSISSDKISADVSQKIEIIFGEDKYSLTGFSVETNSKLGAFYDLAKKIYDYEKKTSFLENYSRDVLYTYAPVSGTELSCSPVIWNPSEVLGKLRTALEANIQAIKIRGNYYTSANDYYITGKDSDLNLKNEQVNFLYSKNWVGRFEVWPTKGGVMQANPLGTQPGLSGMGFCYAPYKFVYDLSFPVMIQISDTNGEELFQFPVAVVISKNVPRVSQSSVYVEQQESICDNANTDISVSTYNINLEPIEAQVQFKCVNDVCNLGKTKLINSTGISSIESKVPQCFNGFLIANAEGYKEKKYMISTNLETSADIILDKEYTLSLEIYVDGQLTSDSAILVITDNSDSSFGANLVYPQNKLLAIAEGDYVFDLKVFRQNAVTIPSIVTTQCVSVPKEGVLGFIGLEEKKCTELTIPSQTLTNVLYAGGKLNQYITPSELEDANAIRIYATGIGLPSSQEEIALGYDKIQTKSLYIEIV